MHLLVTLHPLLNILWWVPAGHFFEWSQFSPASFRMIDKSIQISQFLIIFTLADHSLFIWDFWWLAKGLDHLGVRKWQAGGGCAAQQKLRRKPTHNILLWPCLISILSMPHFQPIFKNTNIFRIFQKIVRVFLIV